MRDGGRWLELEPLRDIDTADDIPFAVASLAAIDAPTAAQVRLLQWLTSSTPPEPCA